MAYLARLYNKQENRFFSVKYLYYTKKEIRQRVKQEYQGCQVISIESMHGWL